MAQVLLYSGWTGAAALKGAVALLQYLDDGALGQATTCIVHARVVALTVGWHPVELALVAVVGVFALHGTGTAFREDEGVWPNPRSMHG